MSFNNEIKLDECLIYSLYVSTNIVGAAAKKLIKKLDISLSQYVLLMTIAAKDGIGFRDAMSQLRIESSALSAMLKNLSQRGLVKKTRAAHDERVVFLKLTSKAKNLLDEMLTIQAELNKHVQLDDADRLTMIKILNKINSANLHDNMI